MKIFMMACFLLLTLQVSAQTILPADVQIKTALLAAPPELRADATVIGYSPSGKFITLKKGNGSIVCLADDPKSKGIKVACYSIKLEPFMARGRQLTEEGKTSLQKKEIRDKEVKEGKLKMPNNPTTLFVLSGKEENYNPSTGELKDGNFRYVVYTPYATLASSGLPAKPSEAGMPWLMDPGTYGAHIMISPPEKE
ncbi:hypothetical protein ACVWYG_002515 [Pedobacter sp. UYEF25]